MRRGIIVLIDCQQLSQEFVLFLFTLRTAATFCNHEACESIG